MELMQKEFDVIENELNKILEKIGIDHDTWEGSRQLYIHGVETQEGDTPSEDGYSIDTIDKRVYEFLPQPNLPKSLSRDKTKQILLDVNHRAHRLFVKEMRLYVEETFSPEFEPLLMESLAFDLTFLEYSINESVFRFATHKYELQKDPEVREYMDEYLSSENDQR